MNVKVKDQTRRAPSGYVLLLALVGVLSIIGLVMVLSASSVYALRSEGSTWDYFIKQSIWLTLGSAAMFVTLKVDYRYWRKFSTPFLCIAIFLLFLVFIPGVGIKVNGAKSWIGIGSTLRVQPSELVKPALLLFTADLLARRSNRLHDIRVSVFPILIIFFFVAALMMLQPDLGSTLVMVAIIFSLFFIAGVPMLPLSIVGLGAGTLAILGALTAGYRSDRISVFLNPQLDPDGAGYQISRSLIGVASGQINGLGLGASRSKWGYLPNAHTDFIFAIISEELGLIGSMLVISLFGAFAFLGMRAALNAPDGFGALIAGGLTAWIMTQAIVNLGGVVGLLPITGLTLPFVSYGGSSLVISMAATGVLLNVARLGRVRVVSQTG